MNLARIALFFDVLLSPFKRIITKACSASYSWFKLCILCGLSRGTCHSANLDTVLNDPSTPQEAVKTPNQLKVKLYSFAKRLSLKNFMDYCVIALNEASTSASSNRFDLTDFQGTVWLLGIKYELPTDLDAFIDDVKSKFWITYRKNFPPIDENNRYTSDKGFGCMIRCGQMVLSNALIYKNLGRQWRWVDQALEINPDVYLDVLKLFLDKETSAYSIHNIIKMGELEGKSAGEWFGPNTIAQTLRRLTLSSTDISIDTALDNIIFIDEVRRKFKKNDKWVSGVLFIQLRLGLSNINPIYFTGLKKTFQLKNSLGIIGGRPNHALYLLGYVNNEVIYLDPHYTQQYIDLEQNLSDRANEEAKLKPLDGSFHCTNPEKMAIDRLDPSLALCFYFRDETEFDEWCKLSEEEFIKREQAPMFEIAPTRPKDWLVTATQSAASQTSSSNRVKDSTEQQSSKTRHDNEVFTILKGSSDESPLELDNLSKDGSRAKTQASDGVGDAEEEFEMLG